MSSVQPMLPSLSPSLIASLSFPPSFPCLFVGSKPSRFNSQTYAFTLSILPRTNRVDHLPTHQYVYIYIYVCMCISAFKHTCRCYQCRRAGELAGLAGCVDPPAKAICAQISRRAHNNTTQRKNTHEEESGRLTHTYTPTYLHVVLCIFICIRVRALC